MTVIQMKTEEEEDVDARQSNGESWEQGMVQGHDSLPGQGNVVWWF